MILDIKDWMKNGRNGFISDLAQFLMNSLQLVQNGSLSVSYKWCCTVTSTNGGQIKGLLLSLEAAVCKSLKWDDLKDTLTYYIYKLWGKKWKIQIVRVSGV